MNADFSLWLQGVLLGFSIAAPVGPIGILCIRRTLGQGRVAGLVTGLGAASADALYGCVTAFGFSLAIQFLVGVQNWLRLAGGLFLMYLGARSFLARPAASGAGGGQKFGLAGAYFSTLGLTLSNPATIFAFLAIFVGVGVESPGRSPAGAAWLVLGVFCGSALWWLILSGLVSLWRERIGARALLWINRLAGLGLAAFGLAILLTLLSLPL